MGTRLREETEYRPKPMVPVGERPILWHIMKTYARFGHKEFILCLGYRADAIKSYVRKGVEPVRLTRLDEPGRVDAGLNYEVVLF